MFSSHNKSANNTFQPVFSAKRTGPVCVVCSVLLVQSESVRFPVHDDSTGRQYNHGLARQVHVERRSLPRAHPDVQLRAARPSLSIVPAGGKRERKRVVCSGGRAGPGLRRRCSWPVERRPDASNPIRQSPRQSDRASSTRPRDATRRLT